MKKKGFTLIELLAVIVVLAVIALITVPTILGVIEKARRSSLQDSGYGLVEAANLYYAQYSPNKTVRFDIENNKITTEEENELKYKGNVKKGTVLINNKGKVTVCINDGKHAAYKNYQDTKVTIVDSKTCTVPENDYIVYLDGEKTIKEMNNQELTDALNDVINQLNQLKQQDNAIKNEINSIKNNSTTVNDIYPVGSIYISTNNIDPATLFKGTIWERYGLGRTLLSTDGNSEETGGNRTVKLTATQIPSLTGSTVAVNNVGSTTSSGIHSHFYNYSEVLSSDFWWGAGGTSYADIHRAVNTTSAGEHIHALNIPSLTVNYTNNNQASVNVQNPYITVYMWKRVS